MMALWLCAQHFHVFDGKWAKSVVFTVISFSTDRGGRCGSGDTTGIHWGDGLHTNWHFNYLQYKRLHYVWCFIWNSLTFQLLSSLALYRLKVRLPTGLKPDSQIPNAFSDCTSTAFNCFWRLNFTKHESSFSASTKTASPISLLEKKLLLKIM